MQIPWASGIFITQWQTDRERKSFQRKKDRWRETEGDLEERWREGGNGRIGKWIGGVDGMSDIWRKRPSGAKNDEQTQGGMKESDADIWGVMAREEGKRQNKRGQISKFYDEVMQAVIKSPLVSDNHNCLTPKSLLYCIHVSISCTFMVSAVCSLCVRVCACVCVPFSNLQAPAVLSVLLAGACMGCSTFNQ